MCSKLLHDTWSICRSHSEVSCTKLREVLGEKLKNVFIAFRGHLRPIKRNSLRELNQLNYQLNLVNIWFKIITIVGKTDRLADSKELSGQDQPQKSFSHI